MKIGCSIHGMFSGFHICIVWKQMKTSFPLRLCLASMWHCMFSVKSEFIFHTFSISDNIVIKLAVVITFMIYDVSVGICLFLLVELLQLHLILTILHALLNIHKHSLLTSVHLSSFFFIPRRHKALLVFPVVAMWTFCEINKETVPEKIFMSLICWSYFFKITS